MASEQTRTYDWDEMIENDGEETLESVVLPDGNYPFEVIKTEKAWFDGSKNLPACNSVKVYMRIDGGELGKGFAVEQIFLCEKTEWKAAAFLRSIGLKKHGEPIAWRQLVHCDGESGRCQIYVDEYEGKNGPAKNNKVRRFFDPEEQQPKKAFTKGAF